MEQTGLQRKHIPHPPRGQREPQLEQRYIWSSFMCEKIILRRSMQKEQGVWAIGWFVLYMQVRVRFLTWPSLTV